MWNSSGASARVLLTFGLAVAGVTALVGSSTANAINGSISGTVTADGLAVSDVQVEACTLDFLTCEFGFSGVDGTWAIGGLPAGDYLVAFYPGAPYLAEYYDGATFETATPVLVVDDVDTGGIDATLEVGGSISGTVTGAGVGPIADVQVAACTLDLVTCGYGFSALDGTWSVGGLPPGDFTVEFQAPGGFLSEYFDDAPNAASATLVPVVGGSDAGPIDAELAADVCIDPTPAFAGSGLVTGYDWVACPGGAGSQVLSSSPTSVIGFDGDGGLLMSTGFAADAAGPNDSESTTGSYNAVPVRDANDVSILQLDLQIPEGAQCLSFDFAFGSEEYPEFVGSEYNDAFIAELGSSTWVLSGSDIVAPLNFAFDRLGNVVSVNSTFFDSVVVDAGWEFDGTTPKLTARTPVAAGPTSLFLSVFDAGDSSYDSAVVIDALRVSSDPCDAGATAGPVWPDFDGDGLADRGVFRPEVGGWYVGWSGDGVLWGCLVMCRCRGITTVMG